MKLHIDFETASDLNLLDVGAYRYATHPSTFVRCMAYAADMGGGKITRGVWFPGEPLHVDIIETIQRGQPVHAWNAQFERLIWQHCMPKNLVMPTYNQWRCTAALARVNGLPGALDDCARVLDTPHQKMDTRVMKKLAQASYTPMFDELTSLALYCQGDVAVEADIDARLVPWTDDELFIYQINERINDLGITIDAELCAAMLRHLEAEASRLNGELSAVTKGVVEKFTQVQRMKGFIQERMGFTPESLDKHAITKLLAADKLPLAVRRLLEIRRDGARSSTSKYATLLDMAQDDDRVRGMFIFAGAGQTGRFSSHGAQLHNLVRATPTDVEQIVDDVENLGTKQLRLIYDEPVIHLASKMIRPTLIAETGKHFIIGDFAAVEAKAMPYLAGCKKEIELWASGEDRYVDDACAVFNCKPAEVDDRRRQAGKVTRLACQFGGKKGALLQMAEGYGLTMSLEEAERAALLWHAANPWAEAYGRELQDAALRAMAGYGESFSVSHIVRVTYVKTHVHGIDVLRCVLPSGRVISYHDARVEESPFGGYQITSVKPRETVRERLWHGVFAENVTQAFCNDLLRHSMAGLWGASFNIVAHVHDEIVAEEAVSRSTEFKEILETVPDWAPGFPSTAKVHVATRYTK